MTISVIVLYDDRRDMEHANNLLDALRHMAPQLVTAKISDSGNIELSARTSYQQVPVYLLPAKVVE